MFTSSPFLVSTSAAFLFWFLLWFACIFSVFVRIARRRRFTGILTFDFLNCFVRRLFPLLCLPFDVVYLFLSRFQYRNWNFMIRIVVRGLQFFLINWYSISKSVISNEIVESSSQSGEPFKRKPFPLVTKSPWLMKRTSTRDAIISWQRWIKVCGPLGKPISD